jgi:hypothetical protein
VFEIPIQVQAVRDISVDVESTIGTLRPESTITLRYSLENNGNVDLDLTPSFELPSGWTVSSSLETVQLPWATSKNLLYTLEAGSNARSGEVKLNLDNGSDRFTWADTLTVEVLPEPTLTFVSLELQDGTTYAVPFGAGTHPSGENLKFTWLLGNEADTTWSPSAMLQLGDGLYGECIPVDAVGKGDVAPVVCNVLIAGDMAPMSEPSFTLVLADQGVEQTTTVGLLVAANEQVVWDLNTVPTFTTGQERQLQVEITNTGNTPLQRQLVVNAPQDWTVSLDGNDVLNLEIGQSVLVRLDVRADSPGTASIGLELAQSTATESAFSFSVSSTGEPIGTSGESGLNSGATGVLLGALLLAAFAALGFQAARNRRQPPTMAPGVLPLLGSGLPVRTAAAPVHPSARSIPAVQPTAAAPPTCWTCRQPITTAMVGCPSCGARYHADGHNGCEAHKAATCVNCGASSNTFVKA